MTPHELALSYVAQGYPVFPCRECETSDPHTGEVKSEKSPYPSNGLRSATKFERIINRWWSDHPEALIGSPTGDPTGFFVLDLDVKPGIANGHDWLSEMEGLHGELPSTRRVKTANGGTHIFFRHVDGVRNRGGLGDGVDVRGDGGFVIMAGSVMSDGRAYTVTDDMPIADAPQWLLDLILPRAIKQHAEPFTYRAGTNDAYVNRAVDDELDKLAHMQQGGRGFALNSSAFSLGQLVGAGALSRQDAEYGLYNAAVSNGLLQTDGEREVLAKIRRGLEAGMREPRNIPEPEHDNTRLVDITRMLENARRKSKQTIGTQSATADDAPVPSIAAPIASNDNDVQEEIGDGQAQDDDTPVHATAFQWVDPRSLPRREFAFGMHYIRKYVSVTVSPGGLGKTSNSIVEALSMTSGRGLAGIKPPHALKVWIFNAEDPRDELTRRIMAACIHYNLKPEDLEGRLFLDSGREQELVIAKEDKRKGVIIQEPIVEAVVEQIERNGIDVMIVDPFVSTHSVNENDNGAIDRVAKLWAQVADFTNCSIDIVHHLRKVADREATVEDARGAVSLIGAARSVRVLNRMSEDQAAQANLNKDDRFGIFSITYGKSNLTPLSHRLDWRRLESVPLGNGRGFDKPQDFAPVVTEWKWPDAEEVAQGLTEQQRSMIVNAVSVSDYKASQKAKNWVGQAVAYSLEIDLEKPGQRQRVASIVKGLLKDGTLREVEDRDPVRREMATFVRAA